MTAAPIQVRHPVVVPPGRPVLEVAWSVPSSAVDGPGNRFVLFLQGCNFDCIACQNPTTIGRCDACGACVDACPHDALSSPTAGVVVFTAANCDSCRACIPPCPIDADPAIRVVGVDTLVDEIRQVAPFLSGITVTGGEPTLQLDGLVALFEALKNDPALSDLTTLVDSNGTLRRRGWERLLPVMDGAMIDLKAGTPELHRELTGHDIEPVWDSIAFLAEAGGLAELRLLVIEGVTDTAAELEAWVEFVLGTASTTPVRIMAFRHQGTRAPAREWPETSTTAVESVAELLANRGLRLLPLTGSPASIG